MIDDTKNKLNTKLRQYEGNNEQLRVALNMAENQTMDLKRKASEA